MNPAGRTFLVTGGASGLGAAVVRMLHAARADVVIADLDRPRGEALAAELGGTALFVPTYVEDERSVTAAVERTVEEFGNLHGAVSCAGVAAGLRLVGKDGAPHDLAAFERVVRINLTGTFNVLRIAAAAIACADPGPDGERGVIVNTASIAAFDGQVGQAAYAASKGGVASLTLPAARDLASRGIRVVAIAPGIFDTPMAAGLPEETRAALLRQVPFPKRPGRPEEFAALVRHVIENPMLNGVTIRLDAGLRLGPT